MMACSRFYLVFALAFASPAVAANDPPYVGHWAVEGSRACEPQGADADLALTVTTKAIDYYASSCAILSTRRLARSGNNVHRLKLRCTGEGGVIANSELILAVLEKTEQRADLMVHIEPVAWDVRSYQRCSK